MNWTRKHTDGKSSKHRKEWRAGRGRYRIIWRNQAFGVTVSAGYQCCVQVFIHQIDQPVWDLVDQKRPLYRTFKAAKDVCEKHADPNYKPVRKKRKKTKGISRKAPMKICSQCGLKIHVRRALCDCGYIFPKKIKRKKK